MPRQSLLLPFALVSLSILSAQARADGALPCDPLDPLCESTGPAAQPVDLSKQPGPVSDQPLVHAPNPGLKPATPNLVLRKADVQVTEHADGYGYVFGEDQGDGKTMRPTDAITTRPPATPPAVMCATPFLAALVDVTQPIDAVKAALGATLKCQNSCLTDKDVAYIVACRPWDLIDRGRQGKLTDSEEVSMLDYGVEFGCSESAISHALATGALSGNYLAEGGCKPAKNVKTWWLHAQAYVGLWKIRTGGNADTQVEEGFVGGRVSGAVDVAQTPGGSVHTLGITVDGGAALPGVRAEGRLNQANVQWSTREVEVTDESMDSMSFGGASKSVGLNYAMKPIRGVDHRMEVQMHIVFGGQTVAGRRRAAGEPAIISGRDGRGGEYHFDLGATAGADVGPDGAVTPHVGAMAEVGAVACGQIGTDSKARFCVAVDIFGKVASDELTAGARGSLPMGFKLGGETSGNEAKNQTFYWAPGADVSYTVDPRADEIGKSSRLKYGTSISVGGTF